MGLATSTTIPDRVERVREAVGRAALQSGRSPEDVEILAASKTVRMEGIQAANEAGIRVFGENRIQEAEEKIPLLTDVGTSWHFIGHLQTNKIRRALELFEVIQSIDSVRLATAVDRIAGESGSIIPVLLEVNTSGEESKFGFSSADIERSMSQLMTLRHLRIEGLMTIGPLSQHGEHVRPAFRSLKALRERLVAVHDLSGFQILSMGMSEDFETAIEEGATMVRLGRVIFGERG